MAMFIGSSSQTASLITAVSKVAPTDVPVLIRGPTGVGKELVAKRLHDLSGRTGRFVAINCSAIPSELMESELFGHTKGAFSGAVSSFVGKIRHAENGTLFLDEIGDMDSSLQSKMLRFLQEGVVNPVGSNEEFIANTRIISATHQPLEDMIARGDFREDLFFRLNVIPLSVAALSTRAEEIAEFFQFFATKFDSSVRPFSIEERSWELMRNYSWPGNVRELEGFCQRLAALYPGEIINLYKVPSDYLPSGMNNTILRSDADDPKVDELANIKKEATSNRSSSPETSVDELIDLIALEKSPVNGDLKNLKDRVDNYERKLIEFALEKQSGNVSRAAKSLGVKRTTLIEKISRWAK
jgi:sigma-54 specific flagellar transcriptional regulator A